MFSKLKKLFGANAEKSLGTQPFLAPLPPRQPVAAHAAPAPAVKPAPVARIVSTVTKAPAAPTTFGGDSLALPLKPVLEHLPANLSSMIWQPGVGDAQFTVPKQLVLAQIALGTVRISFGQLRQSSPPGTFDPDKKHDGDSVEIPLQEILRRIEPGLIGRRPNQKQVFLPAEVSGPFNNEHQAPPVNYSPKPPTARTAAAPSAPATGASPAPASTPSRAVPQFQPGMGRSQSSGQSHIHTPTPSGRPAVAFTQAQPPSIPVVTAPSIAPLSQPEAAIPIVRPEEDLFTQKVIPVPVSPISAAPLSLKTTTAEADPRVYSPIAANPVPEVASAAIRMSESVFNGSSPASISTIAPEAAPEPAPIRFQTPPAIAPMATATGSDAKFITASLAEISEGWPIPLQQEIAAHQLAGATVNLPFAIIEVAIKQGKIALPWRILRSWIKPPQAQSNSAHDATVLELPLKVITPLFMAEVRGTSPARKVAVDHSIPDVFLDGKQAEAAPVFNPVVLPAANKPVEAPSIPSPLKRALQPGSGFVPPPPAGPRKTSDTNYFSKNSAAVDQPEEPAPIVKKGHTPGTAFLNRYAKPNDMVKKATALPGVEGALIALPDGLLVASDIPRTMNAETIAAFVPQIFGRVNQSTNELRLGQLNNLSFTVGQTPWKIFRVGAIYFAAFGRSGESLSTPALAEIAAELDRNPK